ncbi:MAG: metallophosphoesterase family protein [Candidatus Zixiibacteriota bacterium]
MKILVFSDYHAKGEILPGFIQAAKGLSFDVICYTGDILKWRGKATEWVNAMKENRTPDKNKPGIKEEIQENAEVYRKFYEEIGKLGKPTFLIPGNVDAPISQYLRIGLEAMENPNLHIIHHSFHILNDWVIAGFGGEITESEGEDFFVLMYPRWGVTYGLNFLTDLSQKKILLLHTPPLGKLDLDNGSHKGSEVVNDLIQRIKPQWVFCGHAHNAQGEEKIKETTVVNPGALKSNNYVLIETDTGKVEFRKF